MASIRTKVTLFLSSTVFPSFSKSQLIKHHHHYQRLAIIGITTGLGIAAAFSPIPTTTSNTPSNHHHRRITSTSRTVPDTKKQPNDTIPKRSSSTIMRSSPFDSNIGYLTSKSAYELDQELMSQPGFSLEQLMELAGFSVAEATYQLLLSKSTSSETNSNSNANTNVKKSVLILCGPGNNGGDGLVAARHLVHFGLNCTVVYPKRSKGQHFVNLVTQCENLNIPVLEELPSLKDDTDTPNDSNPPFDLVMDALFGFSFKGEPREPLASLLRDMIQYQTVYSIPILSVDIPSGWHVEDGNTWDVDSPYHFTPEALISLTAPKECSRHYKGTHFIGGRFLPDCLSTKYQIRMPPYEGTSQIYELILNPQKEDTTNDTDNPPEEDENDTDWFKQYQDYLNEKFDEENPSNTKEDSIPQDESKEEKEEQNEDEEDWAVAYSKHCIEKEKVLAEKDQLELERQRKQLEQD